MTLKTTSKSLSRNTLRLIAGLILLSTVLFVVGIAAERSGLGTAAVSAPAESGAGAVHPESGEGSAEMEAAEGTAKSESETAHATGVPAEESLLGISTENPWIVAAVVLGWLLLIAALYRFGVWVVGVILVAAIGSLLLDIGEVVRQLGAGNNLIALLAVLVTLAHAALAIVCGYVLVRSSLAPKPGVDPHSPAQS